MLLATLLQARAWQAAGRWRVHLRATVDVDAIPNNDGEELLRTKEELLVAMASTERGQALGAANAQAKVERLASELEAGAISDDRSLQKIGGRWTLAYSSTQLFRSSPFWMAGRDTCSTEDEAERYDFFCDLHRAATAVGSVGAVRQLVDPVAKTLISEFETIVAAYPQRVGGGLPFTVTGTIVSSADIVDEEDDGILVLLMDTVQIRGSNLPGVRAALDSMKLETRRLSQLIQTTPKPRFQTTYCDDSIRIARDIPDRHLFVYVKESEETQPTDYTFVQADLGIPALIKRALGAIF